MLTLHVGWPLDYPIITCTISYTNSWSINHHIPHWILYNQYPGHNMCSDVSKIISYLFLMYLILGFADYGYHITIFLMIRELLYSTFKFYDAIFTPQRRFTGYQTVFLCSPSVNVSHQRIWRHSGLSNLVHFYLLLKFLLRILPQ